MKSVAKPWTVPAPGYITSESGNNTNCKVNTQVNYAMRQDIMGVAGTTYNRSTFFVCKGFVVNEASGASTYSITYTPIVKKT